MKDVLPIAARVRASRVGHSRSIEGANVIDDKRNLVEADLAELLVREDSRGERPSLTEYALRYPELADEIHDLFPSCLICRTCCDGDDRPTRNCPGRQALAVLREIGRGGMAAVYEAEQEA